MSKLLVLYRGDTSTNEIFKNDFPPLFSHLGIEVSYCEIPKVKEEDIMNTDSILLIREMDPAILTLIDEAKKANKFVIAFYDDDLLNLPKTMVRIPWHIKGMNKILNTVDAVLTFSPRIQEKYHKLTAGRCYQMDTPISEDLIKRIPRSNKNSNQFSIVYAASSAHKEEAEEYIVPIIKALGSKYRSDIRIEFVGVKPEIDDYYGIDVRFKDAMPIEEYRDYMREQQFDIGLSPLKVDSFSECKYFNKYIEYTLVGVVGLYTDCKPYVYAIKEGYNGFLLKNDVNEWIFKISTIIENPELLKSCKNNAINQLIKRHSLNCIADKLLEDIPEIVSTRDCTYNVDLKKFRRRIKFYTDITAIRLVPFFLKQKGFSWTVNKVLSKIKRIKNN